MNKVDTDPDSLRRPDGNSLQENYSLHDVGHEYFTRLVGELGYVAEDWGIDKRHEDESLIFDNKMDLRIWRPSHGQGGLPSVDGTDEQVTEHVAVGPNAVEQSWELESIVDVKTKSNDEWMDKFNVRHLAHYAEWADRYDVPVYVYMTLVDADTGAVKDEEHMVQITADWNWELLCDHYDDENTRLTYGEIKDICRECDIVHRVFRAPDGNLVFVIDDDAKRETSDVIMGMT